LLGDGAQRGGLKAVFDEQTLGRVKNAGGGVFGGAIHGFPLGGIKSLSLCHYIFISGCLKLLFMPNGAQAGIPELDRRIRGAMLSGQCCALYHDPLHLPMGTSYFTNKHLGFFLPV
jgi:hypothetical protein